MKGKAESGATCPGKESGRLNFQRISKHIIEQYLLLDDLTSTISDVLDSLGLNVRALT